MAPKQQWNLADRLRALRMPILDRDQLDRMTDLKRYTTLLNFGGGLSTDGCSLYAIVRIPQIWPRLSKVERAAVRSSRVARQQFRSLPEDAKQYFVIQTGKIRGGSIEALFEVLDEWCGRKGGEVQVKSAAVKAAAARAPAAKAPAAKVPSVQVESVKASAKTSPAKGSQVSPVHSMTTRSQTASKKQVLANAPPASAAAAKIPQAKVPHVQARQAQIQTNSSPAAASAPQEAMGLNARITLYGSVQPYAGDKLTSMSKEEQGHYVQSWCRSSLNKSGRTLYVLRKAPEYARLSPQRQSQDSLKTLAFALWSKMQEEDMRPYKTATTRLFQADLKTFVEIITLVLGQLPDVRMVHPRRGLDAHYKLRPIERSSNPVKSPFLSPIQPHTCHPIPSSEDVESSDKQSPIAVFGTQSKKQDDIDDLVSQRIATMTLEANPKTKALPMTARPREMRNTASSSPAEIPTKDKQPAANSLERIDSAVDLTQTTSDGSSTGTETSSEVQSSACPSQTLSKNELPNHFESGRTPVLDNLVPPQTRGTDATKVIAQVLDTLKDRVFPRTNKVLVGRTADGSRVDYNPLAFDITGISNRLQSVVSTDAYHQDMALEALLRPLAEWNADTMFPAIKHLLDTGSSQGSQLAYRSAWSFHADAQKKIAPFSLSDCATAMEVVYYSLRARYCELKGDDPRALLSIEHYLDDLEACFDEPEVSPEGYLDRIERVLHQFEVEHKAVGS